MTIVEIQSAVAPHKRCSKASIHNYLNTLGIRPVGARQRPQRYPDDAAGKILLYLGIEQLKAETENGHGRERRLPSTKQLLYQKRRSQKARAR